MTKAQFLQTMKTALEERCLPDAAEILLQAGVMAAAYLGLSKLFKVEALDYLLGTAKEVVVLRRG